MTDSHARDNKPFDDLLSVYRDRTDGSDDGGVSNADVYRELELGNESVEVGSARDRHNPAYRQVRWQQQTLRQLGLLERVPGKRAVWRLTPQKELTSAQLGVSLVAFSTDLGLCLWSHCEDAFPKLDEPLHLVLTSPPYPLANPRAYGNPDEKKAVDFIVGALEPLIRNLVPGGSIALNLGEVFIQGSPARSTYIERCILALADLGLHKMAVMPWVNPTKPPGPTIWACKQRVQLVSSFEPIIWMCTSPKDCFSDNRRVLQPHTSQHLALMARGGERARRVNGDGAYTIRANKSFANSTEGRIPRDVLSFSNGGMGRAKARRLILDEGLPAHSATMPRGLANFLIRFMTEPGHMVADPFAGESNTCIEAELLGRRWIATEKYAEYAVGGGLKFKSQPGFFMGAELLRQPMS